MHTHDGSDGGCWNAEPMGFNLAVWDNHVGNNQHSFQPLFIIVHYLSTLQKSLETQNFSTNFTTHILDLTFYIKIQRRNWIWWIEKLCEETIFHFTAHWVWFCQLERKSVNRITFSCLCIQFKIENHPSLMKRFHHDLFPRFSDKRLTRRKSL